MEKLPEALTDVLRKHEESHGIQVEEVRIPVPWGYIAGKWWGNRTIRPILLIHGYQDNCGTFETLIPLLPRQFSYLAIDLPGHGLSSQYPDGMMYNVMTFLYAIRLIEIYYKWDKISFISHSYGAILSFLYAALFYKRCDMVVALDSLLPWVVTPDVHEHILRKHIMGMTLYDEQKRNGTLPPIYNYSGLIDRICNKARLPVTEETAPFLLYRAIKATPQNPNLWYFSLDRRFKYRVPGDYYTYELLSKLIDTIQADYLYFRAIDWKYMETDSEYINVINQFKEHKNFTFIQLNRQESHGHHIHLTNPEVISGTITDFILKNTIKQDSKL